MATGAVCWPLALGDRDQEVGRSDKGRAGAAVAGAALSLALGLVGLICSAAACCCGLCGKVRGFAWLCLAGLWLVGKPNFELSPR